MPKKLDYRSEMRSLKGVANSSLRPVTTRVPVECLRKLFQLCERGNTDLSTTVRRILEEQADFYLSGRNSYLSQFRGNKDNFASSPHAQIVVELTEEIKTLAARASEGMAVDLPTLLRLILSEALPGWVIKATKASRERQKALDHTENSITPEQAVWTTMLSLVPRQYRTAFQQLDGLIAEGLATIEVDSEGILSVVLGSEMTAELEADSADLPWIDALQHLINAEFLVRKRLHSGSGSKWQLRREKFIPRGST